MLLPSYCGRSYCQVCGRCYCHNSVVDFITTCDTVKRLALHWQMLLSIFTVADLITLYFVVDVVTTFCYY